VHDGSAECLVPEGRDPRGEVSELGFSQCFHFALGGFDGAGVGVHVKRGLEVTVGEPLEHVAVGELGERGLGGA